MLIEHKGEFYEVVAGNSIMVLIDYNDKIHILQKSMKTSHFALGGFLSTDTVRSMWIWGIINCTSFYSGLMIPVGLKKINITEKYYHCLIFLLFSVFLVNGELTSEYQYQNNVDKFRIKFLIVLTLLPIAIIYIPFFVGAVYGLIFDFSIAAIFINITLIIVSLIFKKIIKRIYNIVHFDKYFKKTIDEAKQIMIFRTNKIVYKYQEY